VCSIMAVEVQLSDCGLPLCSIMPVEVQLTDCGLTVFFHQLFGSLSVFFLIN
jgi:hypothetical protein